MTGNKKNFGFTLLEVLVVLSIFSVLSVVITDIFMMILKSQRQTSARERTLSDLRFITETMARQIRTSEIDYQLYLPLEDRYKRDSQEEGINGWETEIHLIDADNHKISYYLDGTVLKTETDGQLTVLSNSNFYTVNRLFFYIDPPTSPFAQERCNDGNAHEPNGCLPAVSCSLNDQSGPNGYCLCFDAQDKPDNEKCATNNCSAEGYCLPYDRQPRVTIVLGFESKGAKTLERKTIYLQTTAASRVYKR